MVDSIDPTPVRTPSGRRNLDLFLSGSRACPVTYYFEDDGSEELYKRFISKLFVAQTSPLVICTGGKTKTSVLDEATRHGIKPVVFVRDLDFDDIVATLPDDKRIVTLGRYSFENYLIDQIAIVGIAIESKRRLKREDAESKLDLAVYLDQLYARSAQLAALFVVVRKWNLRKIQTTKQPIGDLLGAAMSLPSDAAIARFRSLVLEQAQKTQRISNEEELGKELASALNPKPAYVGHADAHPNAHLCGKHLLDLLLSYVDEKLETTLAARDRFEISMRLSSLVPASIFERVKQAIVAAVGTQVVPGPEFN